MSEPTDATTVPIPDGMEDMFHPAEDSFQEGDAGTESTVLVEHVANDSYTVNHLSGQQPGSVPDGNPEVSSLFPDRQSRVQHGARAGTDMERINPILTSRTSFPDLGEMVYEMARALKDVPVQRSVFPTFQGEDFEDPRFFLRKMEEALKKRHIPEDEWAFHAMGQIKGKEENTFAWYKTQEISWHRFLEEFRETFMSKGRITKLISKFYGESQTDEEDVVRFIQRKRSMARWLLPNTQEDNLVDEVFELLLPRVRYALRLKMPMGMDELTRYARALETDLKACDFNRATQIKFREPAATPENYQRGSASRSTPPK